ncbi:MAG: hypothetical protein QM811_27690 [Pirellulales bacterium]
MSRKPWWGPKMTASNNSQRQHNRAYAFEALEDRRLMAVLTVPDVQLLLARAAAASARQDAIIAVVDRRGEILGVRTEAQVLSTFTTPETLTFAIDGAVAKARTAAFFANDQAPLTSRSVRFISQSTITQREVQSLTYITDPNSPLRGPGTVAPVGIAGTFPPGVNNTGLVDLLGIEHTNRDGIVHPGADGIRGTADDMPMQFRFNIKNDGRIASPNPMIPIDVMDYLRDAPDSYGYDSGVYQNGQSRGIATLPGGIPLYIGSELVGGIGVFFPGATGTAIFEQNFSKASLNPGVAQTTLESNRLNAPLVLQAEYMAFAAAGGVGAIANVPALPTNMSFKPANLDLNSNRIDLVGITVEIIGPGNAVTQGIPRLMQVGAAAGTENVTVNDPVLDQVVDRVGADRILGTGDDVMLRYWNGQTVPQKWIVKPTDGVGITAAQVEQIINAGVIQAKATRQRFVCRLVSLQRWSSPSRI